MYSEGSTAETSIEEDYENGQIRSNEIHEIDGLNNELESNAEAEIETEAEIDEETAEEMENVGNKENEALISERAASGFNESPTVGSPRVQFEQIKEEDPTSVQMPEVPADTTASGHEEDRKCRRHQKHEHK